MGSFILAWKMSGPTPSVYVDTIAGGSGILPVEVEQS